MRTSLPNGNNATHYPFSLNDVAILSTSAAKRLSVLIRASTCAQLCNTVLWSRPPTSFPMRLAGILVYLWAKYIDT